MSDPLIVLKLASPITAYGEEVGELRLREPTVADARALKSLPYSLGEDGMPRPLLDVCARYIASLADVPDSAIDKLGVQDFHKLTWAVAGFFISQGLGQETQQQA